MELRVALEAFVGEQLHHFVEGKCAFDVAFRTGCLDRVIGSLRDAVQEPVDALFFGRGVKGVVMRHLCEEFLKQIDMFGDVGAVDVSEVFNGVS